MMHMIAHMTKAEKKKAAEIIRLHETDPEDLEIVWEAANKGVYINDVIHVRMLKRETVAAAGYDAVDFSADDYVYCCQAADEEELRSRLAERLAEKIIGK